MPVPRHSMALASVQIPLAGDCEGVTELRVHGVGGSPPDATLGDLAPEQVSGDRIAGFYRSADHRASCADQTTRRDADRHVECYSWGGLTSRSKVRVLWLALLPFMLANLAGWMCSIRTRSSGWRFGLHRLSHGLSGLALTINAVLVAVMISADLLAYQAVRAGRAGHQWWLAPLGWSSVSGHPARQILIGVLVSLLFVLLLAELARRSWRYERVPPPFKGEVEPERRTISAAALDGGLAHDRFWDGENSVRQLTGLHIAAAIGFLAVVLGVTVKALGVAGSSHAIALGWIAVGAGGVAVGCAVAFLSLDAFDKLGDTLRGSPPFLLVLAATALVSSGVFAWLQPGRAAGPAAELPGMAKVIAWTALAIAVAVALAFVSMLLGLADGPGTLTGGPWVTLALAFSLLNTVMLGVGIWVAHLVGPVTGDAAVAARTHAIYLPYVITSGVPLVALATVAVVLVFGLTELLRWWRAHRLPAAMTDAYRRQAEAFMSRQPGSRKIWYEGGRGPDPGWERTVARARFLSRAPLDAGWLLWGIVVAQAGVVLCVWQLHWQPPVVIRNVGIALAGLALPVLMGFLYSAWNDPTKRRAIGVLWDVGTFWPRSYHPLSPPSYSERAVPELQRRMWWLHDNDGRVVLAAHSQGAVLATAALVQPGCRPDGDHPSLMTFGSPVVKLYGWGFPAYVTPQLLTALAPEGRGGVDDWCNQFYETDPIGGPVAVDFSRADGSPVDRNLLDPAQCWYVYGQPAPVPRGHTGYWADPRVWAMVDRLAATGPRIPVGSETEPAGILAGRDRELTEAPAVSPSNLVAGLAGGVEAVEVPVGEEGDQIRHRRRVWEEGDTVE
jgi:hypothetical protein